MVGKLELPRDFFFSLYSVHSLACPQQVSPPLLTPIIISIYLYTTPCPATALLLPFFLSFFNMSAAQEEFDRLVQANKESSRTHPEDRHQSDNDDSSHSNNLKDEYELSDADSDYADRNNEDSKKSSKMVSRTGAYTVPTTVFEANTGPKGVIADAQSFERARKRSFRRTLLSVAGLDSYSKNLKDSQSRMQKSSSPPSEDEEDEFMRRWRESRLQELQERNQRRPSPSKRIYGTFDDVDAEGYLNAIERVSSETVIVVCIYDPEVCPFPILLFYIFY